MKAAVPVDVLRVAASVALTWSLAALLHLPVVHAQAKPAGSGASTTATRPAAGAGGSATAAKPAAAATAALAPASRSDVEALFAEFAAQGARRAKFVERRYSVLFRSPPESRGTLSFKPPALLERETVSPRRERVRIDGNQVTMWITGDDGRVVERQIRLDVVPQLAALADTLRALLGGDLRALERLFVAETLRSPASARGTATGVDLPAHWMLNLKPIDASISAIVSAARIEGRAGRVERIEFTEASGDRSELSIVPIEPERR